MIIYKERRILLINQSISIKSIDQWISSHNAFEILNKIDWFLELGKGRDDSDENSLFKSGGEFGDIFSWGGFS